MSVAVSPGLSLLHRHTGRLEADIPRVEWWAEDDLGNNYLASGSEGTGPDELAEGKLWWFGAPLHPKARRLCLLPTGARERGVVTLSLEGLRRGSARAPLGRRLVTTHDQGATVGGLQVVTDGSVLSWFAEGVAVGAGRGTLGSLVPGSFDAYVRVFHPAYRDEDVGTTAEVRWSEVAAANGALAHPDMQWPSITGSWRYIEVDTQPGLWDRWPARGSLPETLAARLVRVLEGFTSSPANCNFAVWHGFNDLRPRLESAPRFELRPGQGLGMVLLSGELSSATTNLAREPWRQLANLWWPSDRSWFVYTGVDGFDTFVGGSKALAGALLRDPGLEAHRVELNHGLAWGSDPVNPAPTRG